jgi:hypothetical protein
MKKILAILTAVILLSSMTAFAADTPQDEPKRTTGQTVADGTGSISDTALTYKLVDGKDLSRRDYSQDANPAIFNERWTRGMYNALYQTIIDRDHIIPGNGENGKNPYYSYAHAVAKTTDDSMTFTSVMASISRQFYYYTDAEPYAKDLYKHPGYFIVTVKDMEYAPDKATEDAIAAAKDMSARDAVISLNKFLQTRLTYDAKSAAGIQKVFTSTEPVKGACGTYSYAFQYLMERVGIPCISINGDNHSWTMVYIDGKWLNCDPTNSKKTNDGLLKETIRFKPYDPQRLAFAQEIAVPGSTK